MKTAYSSEDNQAYQQKDKDMSYSVGTLWDKYRVKRCKFPYHRFETDRDKWIKKIVGILINNPTLRLPEAVELFFSASGAAAVSYWLNLSQQGKKRFHKDLAKKVVEVLCE